MKITYAYDALCGWCYGFMPVMSRFHEKHQHQFEFEIVSGGMITGDRIGPIGEVAPYISWAYKEVENATGVKFGNSFLNKTLAEGSAIFTSIPPAVALSVFKNLSDESPFHFAAEIQKAIYYDGIEPNDLNAYAKIAAKFSLDSDEFISKMQDPYYLELAKKDFEKSSRLNVNGFPTVFISNNENYKKIASGYVPFNTLEQNLKTL